MVSPPDELPLGQAAPAAEPCAPVERGSKGQVLPGASARLLGQRGGLTSARRKADASAWGARLGLGRHLTALPENEMFGPFAKEAEEWLQAASADLSATAGGGRLSPSVTSMLRAAAWARAYSAFLYDAASRRVWAWDRAEGEKPEVRPNVELVSVASRLADSSRQNSLCAYELASREAQSRAKAGPAPGGLPPGFEYVEDGNGAK
jgi:hypothetical protein